jgi:predicted CoA-binding protein
MFDLPSHEALLDLFEKPKAVAVVGISANPDKDAHTVPQYLQEQGYTIVPVNPRGGTILGEEVRASLTDLEAPADIVNVFRPPEEGPGIARQAAQIGAQVLWMQPGTESEDAVRIAEEAGLEVVAGHCIRATHRLLGL